MRNHRHPPESLWAAPATPPTGSPPPQPRALCPRSRPWAHLRGPEKSSYSWQQLSPQHLNPLGQVLGGGQREAVGTKVAGRPQPPPNSPISSGTSHAPAGWGGGALLGACGRTWGWDLEAWTQELDSRLISLLVPSSTPFWVSLSSSMKWVKNIRRLHWAGVGAACCSGRKSPRRRWTWREAVGANSLEPSLVPLD